MEWLSNNWAILVGLIAILIVIAFSIYKFVGLPTSEQITKIKKWLLIAVIQAERDLGGGTGVLKLRAVYSLFITTFPVVAKLISFETFSAWVDEALDEMKNLLKTNDKINTLISGK